MRRFLIVAALSLIFLAPLAVSAWAPGQPIVPACEFDADGPYCTACDLITLVNNLLGFAVYLTAFIATIMFAYAGFLYVTAATSAENIKKAKDIFGKVFLGFVFVLTAWLIVDIVLSVFTEKPFGFWTNLDCQGGFPTLEDAASSTITTLSSSAEDAALGAALKNNNTLVNTNATPEIIIPEDASYEDGVAILQQLAAEDGAEKEQVYVFIENEDGSTRWVYLGTGGDSYSKPGQLGLTELIEQEIADGNVKTITLFHTHPYNQHEGSDSQNIPSTLDVNYALILKDEYGDAIEIKSAIISDTALIGYDIDPDGDFANGVRKAQEITDQFQDIPEVQQEYERLNSELGALVASGQYDPRLIDQEVIEKAQRGELGEVAKKQVKDLERTFKDNGLYDIQLYEMQGRTLELQRLYEKSGVTITVTSLEKPSEAGE